VIGSDIEIAQAATLKPIIQLAQDRLGIPAEALEPYGHYKAKIDLQWLNNNQTPNGKLVLVTAISPTPAGEGKTTTTVGLGDALNRIGKRTVIALREPSLGPVFGMKGGAAGGGGCPRGRGPPPKPLTGCFLRAEAGCPRLATRLSGFSMSPRQFHPTPMDGPTLGCCSVRRPTWHCRCANGPPTPRCRPTT